MLRQTTRSTMLAALALFNACGGATNPSKPDNAVSFTYSGAVNGSFNATGIDATGATDAELLAVPTMNTIWDNNNPFVSMVVTRPTTGRRMDMFRITFPRNTGVFQVSTKAVQMFLYLGLPVDSSSLGVAIRPDSAFYITTGNPLLAPVSGQMTVNHLVFEGRNLVEIEGTFSGIGPRVTDGQSVTVAGTLSVHAAPPSVVAGKLCALLTNC